MGLDIVFAWSCTFEWILWILLIYASYLWHVEIVQLENIFYPTAAYRT